MAVMRHVDDEDGLLIKSTSVYSRVKSTNMFNQDESHAYIESWPIP